MYFYKVWVSSPRYHGNKPLTYQSEELLNPGSIVEVPLTNNFVMGFIQDKHTKKPAFKSKKIKRNFSNLYIPEEQRKLHSWLLEYYPAPSGVITQLFVPNSLPKNIYTDQFKKRQITAHKKQTISLTEQQKQAITKITAKNATITSLLHGETGSGKTHVYIELARQTILNNRSAIILTPEIGLTPQLVQSFKSVFGEQIIVTHSRLTDSERRNLWLEIANSKQPLIVIGPRSALFSPLKNIGLIVLDEAHDNSYKQDQLPYYQTQRVAAKLATLSNARCVLGTATPRVSDYYSLKHNLATKARMDKPIGDYIVKPKIKCIDRKDKNAFGKSYFFSDELLRNIDETIQKKQQVLLFLNRRGTARLILCEKCNWQALCPDCSLPLVYHQDIHSLRCHNCTYSQNPPTNCPKCDNTDITFKTAGSKALETELNKYFPYANTVRFDSDTPSQLTLNKQYEAINQGKIDVIVGTQMIAKGLHLPNLALVGIPFADSSLYLPDFTAEEQTYQLITQVMGRVGRTDKNTRVIIQTYNPDNPTIKAAINKNWNMFYKNQLQLRSLHKLPPFYSLLRLECSRKKYTNAQKIAIKLANDIKTNHENIIVLGPSPSFRHKSREGYHWQIIVKSKNRQILTNTIKSLPSGWRYNLDPVNLL